MQPMQRYNGQNSAGGLGEQDRKGEEMVSESSKCIWVMKDEK